MFMKHRSDRRSCLLIGIQRGEEMLINPIGEEAGPLNPPISSFSLAGSFPVIPCRCRPNHRSRQPRPAKNEADTVCSLFASDIVQNPIGRPLHKRAGARTSSWKPQTAQQRTSRDTPARTIARCSRIEHRARGHGESRGYGKRAECALDA